MSITRVRRVVIAGVATIGAFGATSVAAVGESPAADPAPLLVLCERKGGDFFVTPMAIGRCQDVRDRKGFAVEQAVCEDDLGGQFASSSSFNRPNRSTWVCLVS